MLEAAKGKFQQPYPKHPTYGADELEETLDKIQVNNLQKNDYQTVNRFCVVAATGGVWSTFCGDVTGGGFEGGEAIFVDDKARLKKSIMSSALDVFTEEVDQLQLKPYSLKDPG